ncbi:MAG: hypothetical protein OXF20_01275 [Gammaproteobacteria bacterium]|nr:hypothetical protein [Gammaproteobacteria bacterium]
MNSFLKEIREKVDESCLTRGGLKKQGCEVPLKNVPHPRLVVDFDNPGSPLSDDSHRCDYLLAAEDQKKTGWVVLLELKRGKLDASTVVKQLKAGSLAAEEIVPARCEARFRPVAASGGISKHEIKQFRKKSNMISYRGKREIARLISCGQPLNSMLRS